MAVIDAASLPVQAVIRILPVSSHRCHHHPPLLIMSRCCQPLPLSLQAGGGIGPTLKALTCLWDRLVPGAEKVLVSLQGHQPPNPHQRYLHLKRTPSTFPRGLPAGSCADLSCPHCPAGLRAAPKTAFPRFLPSWLVRKGPGVLFLSWLPISPWPQLFQFGLFMILLLTWASPFTLQLPGWPIRSRHHCPFLSASMERSLQS